MIYLPRKLDIVVVAFVVTGGTVEDVPIGNVCNLENEMKTYRKNEADL